MDCPHCKLINPDTALRCDCGYDFQLKTMKQSYLGGKSPSEPAMRNQTDSQVNDSLAGWAITAVVFSILSITVVGGAIGGLIAGAVSFPITKALPVRADGRKLPVSLSIALIVAAVIVFIVGTSALIKR